MEKIVDLQLKQIQQRLAEQGLSVSLTPAARTWLAKEGYDPAFGARPLRRALQKHIESPLSVGMLQGEYKSGTNVMADYVEGKGIVFQKAK
jgi:ATP-dependent Clp protease ATP-binding subunit ClpC